VSWPIAFSDVTGAAERIRPYLPPSPVRAYPTLDVAVGHGIRVLVKHENLQPTGAFKVRNGLSAVTALSREARERGVVAASTGNHGQGLAYAGSRLGVAVTICVPVGNNPEKNAAIRALGGTVVEEGRDYDEAIEVANRLVRERGLTLVHSTNSPHVVAGAGTIALELLEAQADLDAMVIALGGGSQAVGAMTVARERAPHVRVFAVQAAGASATHDAWHTGEVRTLPKVDTFAEGLATRSVYPFTFEALRTGLAGFVTVTDRELAEAMRLLLRTTHTLVEGAGAAGLAGLLRLRETLKGARVGVILSGANVDETTLRRVMTHEI
jgi:threonine dehydratase